MKKSDLVVKDNALIQSSYSLSLVEARLILLAIVEARETGNGITAESYLEVHASHYADHFHVTIHTAYQALSEAVQTLFHRQVTIYTMDVSSQKPEKRVIRWVSAISYVEDIAKVKIRFAPDIVPLITRLEKNFTSYELEQVSGLKSAYAVRLYELLVQWRSVGKTPIFPLEQFREQMGVEPDQYVLLHNLKSRVLDHSIDQINQHTDISVSYQQHKQGRLIVGFSFSFEQKRVIEPVPLPTRKPKAQTQKTAELVETWDRLHALELKSCQAVQPELTREMVEQQAKQQGKSMIQVMQQIQIAAVVRRNPA